MTPEDLVDASLDKFDGFIDQLEASARPFVESDITAVSEALPALDRAKLRVALAYATTSVYFSMWRWVECA